MSDLSDFQQRAIDRGWRETEQAVLQVLAKAGMSRGEIKIVLTAVHSAYDRHSDLISLSIPALAWPHIKPVIDSLRQSNGKILGELALAYAQIVNLGGVPVEPKTDRTLQPAALRLVPPNPGTSETT